MSISAWQIEFNKRLGSMFRRSNRSNRDAGDDVMAQIREMVAQKTAAGEPDALDEAVRMALDAGIPVSKIVAPYCICVHDDDDLGRTPNPGCLMHASDDHRKESGPGR